MSSLNIDEWTVILVDLFGQEILDISHLVDFKLDVKLNDVSTLTFDLSLVMLEKICASINASPRNVLYPQKTEVKVYLNGQLKFGGIVSKADATLDKSGSKISCSADSYLQYFAKRHITKTYTGVNRSHIAWDAINTVQSVPNGNLGVTQGVLATTYSSDLQADIKDVKSIIQLYTYAQPTTYDFEITPNKVFNTYARLGSDKPEIELVYPQNIASITVPRGSDSLANRVIGIGSGIGSERKTSFQSDETSQLTYRIIDKKVSYTSVSNQDTLDDNTRGVLEESREVLVLPKVKPQNNALDLNDVWVGDSIKVKVEGHTYIDDLNGMFRIYGMGITVNSQRTRDITLDFYNPVGGGGLGAV